MQISLQLPSKSIHSSPWISSKKHLHLQFQIGLRSKTLKVGTTSFQSEYNTTQVDNHDNGSISSNPPPPASLPVVIHRRGQTLRYSWDGTQLQLSPVDACEASSSSSSPSLGFSNFVSNLSSSLRSFFIPQKVGDNYISYVKWKCLHRVFSSALQVLATQAMFRAIGIGSHSRSFASAAAFNWVLKDGLGRLSRCIYTACLASAFDTNLKRVRFSTSILFSFSIGLEMLTPTFPQYFLLIASIANIAKQISLACYLATTSAVHQSFAIADNIGEVSAKSQIQTVTFDNLGLLLAAILNAMCKNSERLQAGLPFVAYPVFAAMDLFGIYQGLKHVHLQTLTKDRLEIVMNTWISRRYAPSPAEVSKAQGIDLWGRECKKPWAIRIGGLDSSCQLISPLSMLSMQSLSCKDFYLICLETPSEGLKISSKNQGILLSIRDRADMRDVIHGMLQACYLRKMILFSSSYELIADKHWEMSLLEWVGYLRDSKKSADADMDLFIEQVLALGWSVKNILLSTAERARYSFIEH